MIVVDVIVISLDLANAGHQNALEIIALILVTYFLAEISIRIFAKGFVIFN